MRVANLFDDVPLFLLENQYLSMLKKAVESGKKINFDRRFVLDDRLKTMINNNEEELFAITIKHTTPDGYRMAHLLEHAIDKGKAGLPFVNLLLKNQLIPFLNDTKHGNYLEYAYLAKNYAAISSLLAFGDHPGKILIRGDIYARIRTLLNNEKTPATLTTEAFGLHDEPGNDNLPFYKLTEKLLYVAAYLRPFKKHNVNKAIVNTLINELEAAYHDYSEGQCSIERLQSIETRLSSVLKPLGEADSLLQKAQEAQQLDYLALSDRGNKLSFNSFQFTSSRAGDLHDYLRLHPNINNIYMSSAVIATDILTLLTSLKSIKKLSFYGCKLSDEHLKILSQAPFLNKVTIDCCDGVSLEGVKALTRNPNLQIIRVIAGCSDDVDYYDPKYEEINQWMKQIHKKPNDQLAKAKETTALEKITRCQNHLERLEDQVNHTKSGKRGRAKKQSLLGQISIFTQRLQDLEKGEEAQKRLHHTHL